MQESPLTLQQADQARTDFALIEEHLDFISGSSLAYRRGSAARAA